MKAKEGRANVVQIAMRTKFSITPVVGVVQNTLKSILLGGSYMKFPYFKIKEAFDEARDSFSYGSGSDKLTSAAKLLGKSVANVGMLVAEVGVEAIKRTPEAVGQVAKQNLDKNSHLMSEEQIERAREIARKGDDARERRLEKEREEEDERRIAEEEKTKLLEQEKKRENQ